MLSTWPLQFVANSNKLIKASVWCDHPYFHYALIVAYTLQLPQLLLHISNQQLPPGEYLAQINQKNKSLDFTEKLTLISAS